MCTDFTISLNHIELLLLNHFDLKNNFIFQPNVYINMIKIEICRAYLSTIFICCDYFN